MYVQCKQWSNALIQWYNIMMFLQSIEIKHLLDCEAYFSKSTNLLLQGDILQIYQLRGRSLSNAAVLEDNLHVTF